MNSYDTSEDAGVGRKVSGVGVLDGLWDECLVLMLRTILRTERSTAETSLGREEVEL